MNSSSTSVMKQPLVLPVTSISAAGGSNVASTSTAATSHANGNVSSTTANPNVPSKTRREARRERKLQKQRNTFQPYNPHSLHPHSQHHHHQHVYTHTITTPMRRREGVGTAQRLGGWFIGGGSGSGGGSGAGGAGSWSGSSGFAGGFGSLTF
jgi:hypothetical protein